MTLGKRDLRIWELLRGGIVYSGSNVTLKGY